MATAFSKDQREFIVRCLASFWPRPEICAALVARWDDTKCAPEDLKRFDPAYALLPPDLHTLWTDTRAAVIADPASAPFADQRLRLIELSRQAEFYIKEGKHESEVRTVFRQIAEEKGEGGDGKGGHAGAPPAAPITKIELVVVDPKPLPE